MAVVAQRRTRLPNLNPVAYWRAFKDRLAAQLTYDKVYLLADGSGAAYEIPREEALKHFKAVSRSLPEWGRRRWLWAIPGAAILFTAGYVICFTVAHLPNVSALLTATVPAIVGAALGAWRAPMPQGEILARRSGVGADATVTAIALDAPIVSDDYAFTDVASGRKEVQKVVYTHPEYVRDAEEMKDEKEGMTGPQREVNKIQLGTQIFIVVGLFAGIMFYAMADDKDSANSSSPPPPAAETSTGSVPVLSSLPKAGEPFSKEQARALLTFPDSTLIAQGFTEDQLTVMRQVVFFNAAIPPKYQVN